MTRQRLLGTAFALSLVATTSFAQTRPAAPAAASSEKTVFVGFQGNWSDAADFGLGARVAFKLDKYVKNVELVGTFDYFFPGTPDDVADSTGVWSADQSYMSWGVNGVRMLSLDNTTARPYVGAGLNIARYKLQLDADWSAIGGEGSDTFGETKTIAGVNLIAGVLFKERFFAEARYELNSVGAFVITGGVRF
jgi:hypothetical protein